MLEDMESARTQLEHSPRLLRRSKTLVEDIQPLDGEVLVEDLPAHKAEIWKEETSRHDSLPNIDRPLPVSRPNVPQKQAGVTRSAKSKSDAADAYLLREQCRKL